MCTSVVGLRIGFIDPIYPCTFDHPTDAEYLEELYYHSKIFFKCSDHTLVAHDNLQIFDANECNDKSKLPALSWCSSWGEHPMKNRGL